MREVDSHLKSFNFIFLFLFQEITSTPVPMPSTPVAQIVRHSPKRSSPKKNVRDSSLTKNSAAIDLNCDVCLLSGVTQNLVQ